MLARIGPHSRRRTIVLAFFLSLIVFVLFNPAWRIYTDPLPRWRQSEAAAALALPRPTPAPTPSPLSPLPPVPELEAVSRATPLADEYCHRRFTASYLEDLRDHAFQYCSTRTDHDNVNDNDTAAVLPSSSSRLTCFHAHARSDNEADSFCLASGARLDISRGRFMLDCTVREPAADETARGIVPLGDMRSYWYETGPRTILDQFVSIEGGEATAEAPETDVPETATEPAPFVLLVKREGNGNLWHCLMEIWAMSMSMDVLRMSRAEGEEQPLFRFPDDMERTQVVVLDDHDLDGPTYDLWRLFSHRPAVRLRDVVADPSRLIGSQNGTAPVQLILPLPGASNPLWQNDWELRGCGSDTADAPLLRLFVRRVLEQLGVPPAIGPRVTIGDGQDEAITITFLDRQGTRRLLHQDGLLARLRAAYPAGRIALQVVNMAALSLVEQIRIVQQTDVLVGVHGAALTHAMFMRQAGGGALVEIQPAGLGYRGFRNLATMRGLHYFSAQAEIVGPGQDEDEDRTATEDAKDVEHTEQAEQEDWQGQDTESDSAGVTVELARRDGEWQFSNVRIEEDRFLQLLDAAIKSQYSVGQRNWDVV